MKKVKFLFFFIVFSFLTTAVVTATDIDLMYQRLFARALYNPSKTEVDAALALLNGDGTFSDLNYTQTSTDLTVHLTRIYSLAAAYQHSANFYYHDLNLKSKYFAGLQCWVSKNHQPSNWWYRHIGYPANLGPSFMLMNVELQAENASLFSNTITYLRWAYLQNNYMDGANGADKIAGAFPASVLTKNDTELKAYQTQIMALVAIQNKGEGIEVDMMFGEHSAFGRQVYANYGIAFLSAVLAHLSIVNGTVYSIGSKEWTLLEDYHLQGIQWYMYKNRMDICQTGRRPSSTAGVGGVLNNTKQLLDMNTPRSAEIALVYDRIKNGAGAASLLVGNKMSWRFDYMIHRRPAFYVSSRMTSTRTVGLETGDGEGTSNYYGGSGLNFIFRTGKEYDGNYFSIFNSRQFPGITVEQDNASIFFWPWGFLGTNGNAFAGGVSDGNYGASGMIYSKRNVTAYKSWFYFDNEFVALGCGISESSGSAPVFTTINQALQKGIVQYSQNNVDLNVTDASGTTNLANPDWILQDSIAYLNLLPVSNFKVSSDLRSATPVFTVGIDHGLNPTNSTYAYAVYPNTSLSAVKTYRANLPFRVLSNTKIVQAVYQQDLKLTQALFFSAGSLVLADGKILTVNIPCALMLKKVNATYEISVANPLCESSNPASLTLTTNIHLTGTGLAWDGNVSTIIFALPQGDYAGQSVTKTVGIFDVSAGIDFGAPSRSLLYPNPASDVFYLNAMAEMVEVYDWNGKLLLQHHKCTAVNVSTLSAGMYLVKISTPSKRICYSKISIVR